METLESFQQNRRVIEDFSSRTLAVIPSELGKLWHVATLRDEGEGRYRHAGLETLYSQESVDASLAYCHRELFERILELPLEEQERDLRLCLAGMGETFAVIAARWQELELCQKMIPSNAPRYLQELFKSNIQLLLALLLEELPEPVCA
ncbi:MAG: hypothetical protein ACRD50_14755 [Candidatus Acidiferrales bacterium]